MLLRDCAFQEFEKISSLQFFKQYYSEYEFNDPNIKDNLMPFEELGEGKDVSRKLINKYCKNLAERIHDSVSKYFNK